MQRYFIYIAYDGTNYHGWQIQPNGISVQECLMKALSTLLQREVDVTGAGRTDAGVHAKCYVANFRTTSTIPVDRLPYALNTHLPVDIVVTKAFEVHGDFMLLVPAPERSIPISSIIPGSEILSM